MKHLLCMLFVFTSLIAHAEVIDTSTMSPQQFSQLPAHLISTIPPEELSALPLSYIAALTLHQRMILNKAQRQALKAEQIIVFHHRSQSCWSEATLRWYGHSAEEVHEAQAYLIETASPKEITANLPMLISSSGTPPFPADLIPLFTADQIAALPPVLLKFFTPAHASAFTPAQRAAMSEDQRDALLRP
jgi:hypothetical protein